MNFNSKLNARLGISMDLQILKSKSTLLDNQFRLRNISKQNVQKPRPKSIESKDQIINRVQPIKYPVDITRTRKEKTDVQDIQSYIQPISEYIRFKNNQQLSQILQDLNDESPYYTSNYYLMRRVAVSYFFKIGAKYRLKRDSIYLALTIFDRYTSKCQNKEKGQKLQKIAVTCLWIASKMIQYYPPSLDKIKSQHSSQEIMKLERTILRQLDFNLNISTIYTYLQFYLDQLQFSQSQINRSFYMADVIIFNWNLFTKTHPQLVALAIVKIMSYQHKLILKNRQDIGQMVKRVYQYFFINQKQVTDSVNEYNPHMNVILKLKQQRV